MHAALGIAVVIQLWGSGGIPGGALRGDPRVPATVLTATAESCAAFTEWLKTRAPLPPRILGWALPADCTLSGTTVELMERGFAVPPGAYADVPATDDKGAPLRFADGRPVPYEPLVLNLGPGWGPRSNSWALMSLPEGAAARPEWLHADPRRYAAPILWPKGPVMGVGPLMLQTYYNLAVLAQLWGGAGAEALSNFLFGRALFHLAALAHPLNTVQLGFDGFEEEADILVTERKLRTLGGLLGSVPSPTTLARHMRENHRAWMEALLTARTARAETQFWAALKPGAPAPNAAAAADGMTAVWPALLQDDGEFKKDMEMAVARALVKNAKAEYFPAVTHTVSRLVEFTSRDGPEMYRHGMAVGSLRLRDLDTTFDPLKDDPDAFLLEGSNLQVKAHLESLFWLQARAFARTGTALRLAFSRYRADVDTKDDAQKTARAAAFSQALHRTVTEWDVTRAERVRSVQQTPPAPPAGPVVDPLFALGMLAAPLTLLALIYAFLRYARRAEKNRRDMERIQLPGA